MCRPFLLSLATLVWGMGSLSAEAPPRWRILESQSRLEFDITFNAVMEATGVFGEFSGSIGFDPESMSGGEVEVEIDLRTLTTGNERRDNHLQANDFFNTAEFPLARFLATRWEADEAGTFLLHGQLTIRERTAPVVLNLRWEGAETDRRDRIIGLWSGTALLDRNDWGISYGATIGNEVRLRLKIAVTPEG